MPQPTGSWKTGSGLLDDFDFSIEEAWFGTHEKYGDTVLLNLRGIAEQDVDGNIEVVDDEQVLLFSCGDGWEVAKGGTLATHSAGKDTFINNSNMGRLINAVVGLGDEVLEEMQGRGETYEADTWVGLKFHIERKQFTFKDRQTGEATTYEVPLPTDFLGTFEPEGEEKPKAKPTARTRGKAKAEPEPEADEAEAEEEAPKPRRRGKKANTALRDAVIAFASEYEDHADFVEEVFDPEEFDQAEALQGDEELSADVLDEDGSVWQKSREE